MGACVDRDIHYIEDDCGIEYELSEVFFGKVDTLTFEVAFFFFSTDRLFEHSMEADKKHMLRVMNKDFNQSGIRFVSYSKTKNIVEKKYAENMVDFDMHSLLYSKKNTISVFVYPSYSNSPFQGKANKIPGYSFGIKQPYLRTNPHILSHEMGHVLGLYHTHQPDESRKGNTSSTGDRVCDTPKSMSLLGKITEDCEAASFMNIDRILISNYMSYVPDKCRENFTEGQVERMKWSIENSRDLINALR